MTEQPLMFSDTRRMWSCNLCSEVFHSKLLVLKHRQVHSTYRPYRCSVRHCIQSFSTLSALQCHRRQHCDLRTYHCNTCGENYLLKSHLLRHRCTPGHKKQHRCHSCRATFPRILSLAHHIHAHHRKYNVQQSLKNSRLKCRKSTSPIIDDSKILLKITAGKSMTIISPTKNRPDNDNKKRHGRKSKKKHRKEEKETKRKGIILSIKKGTVNLSDRKRRDKIVPERRCSSRLNKLQSDYKVGEQKSELKLTIKTNSLKERFKVCDTKMDTTPITSHVSVKKAHSLTDIDKIDKSGLDTNTLNETEEAKVRNGIVITKDKSGKFLAEQLQSSKVKKKDRDNVFDSFNDVGLWKVMPSPRTDRPLDVLKLKLSPHKPVRVDTQDDGCNYNASKYLDIPLSTGIPKTKSDASGEDSDAVVSSPAFDKESDGGINNVNDSGIEVLSSSSCNRSNGNSVRSVALEDNSPTYLHTEDSLLSLDSPYTDSMNKSEHSICHKCGGIILEANNNTRSPGKCRCNLSNPNSPFQTPVSPLKSSSQVSDSTKSCLDNVYSIAHKSLLSLDSSGEKEDVSAEIIRETSNTHVEEESDVLIISSEDNARNSDKRTRLKLKIRPPKGTTTSPVKQNKKTSPKAQLNKSNSYGFVPDNKVDGLTFKRDLGVEFDDVQSAEQNLSEISTQKDILPFSVKNYSGVNDDNIKSDKPNVIVIDDEDGESITNQTKTNLSSDSKSKDCLRSRKKPLFKCKKQLENKNESQTVNESSQITEKQSNTNDKLVTSKKPLFKKRMSISEDKSSAKIPDTLINTQVSELDIKEDKTVSLKLDSKAGDNKLNESEANEIDVNSSVKSKSVNELSKLSVNNEDDDSLVQFSDVHVDPPEEVPKPSSTPLDLFQQQFLSFLSKSMNSSKPDVNKNSDSLSDGENESNSIKDNEDKTEVVKNKPNKASKKIYRSAKSKSAAKNELKSSNVRQSLEDSEIHSKEIENKDNDSKIKVLPGINGVHIKEKSNSSEINLKNVEASQPKSEIPKTDSFSWLKIFSSNDKSELTLPAAAVGTTEDVMTDLSEDLAQINKKMDVSEDDDSNSLDMDDVFEVGRLSSLEPKTIIPFNVKSTGGNNNDQTGSHIVNDADTCKPKYSKRQTAKRTIGRFKTKKIVECSNKNSDAESVVSGNRFESDPEYDPFMDSDDDFVKCRKKFVGTKGCSRTKRKYTVDSSDSDIESRYASDCDQYSSELSSSRSRRTKKGRKSCCPCCLGSRSPRKRSSSPSVSITSNGKLPRNHKQYIKQTLKLLQLQEKIHSLFLTLFPECADMIMCSKVGTDDFASLIDEVVGSLDNSSGTVQPQISTCKTEDSVGKLIGDHGTSNSNTQLTQHGSMLSEGHVADGTEKGQIVWCSNEVMNLDTKGHINNDEMENPLNSGTFVESGNIWQHSTLYNQTLLTSSHSSASSLRFENNTLNDDDEPLDNEIITENVSLPSTYTCNTVSQEAHASKCDPCVVGNTQEDNNVHLLNNDGNAHFKDSTEPPPEFQYFTPINPIPAVQNEITITLDLNAVRVSLCRSPKHCLRRLHDQMVKLCKLLLPKITFKNYFYRNLDNLEFMVDLMLDSNSKNQPVDTEEEMEVSDVEEVPKWSESVPEKIEILEPPLIQECDTVQVNFFSSKTDTVSEDREPLFVKCSDLFEQQIKSQRESLKKDVFLVEEDKIETDWKSAEDVLNSINSINKIAQRSRGRPRRDSRLRKRSADEKRTLFVQEKLQNNQNSTFVCDSPIKTRPGLKGRPGRKRIRRESSKEKFLSELNLGDKLTCDDKSVEKTPSNGRKRLKCSNSNPLSVLETCPETNEPIVDKKEAENVEYKLFDVGNDASVKTPSDTESGLKSPDKNIFELMQPS
ncbi:hypothetical protein ACF0H5_005377 [Mactra antiquata]